MLQSENPGINQLKQIQDVKRMQLKGFVLQMTGS